MSFVNRRLASSKAAICCVVLLHLIIKSSDCQATDGDEQFQAYHQDIGRISGAQSQSPVAPQSVVRQVAATTPAPVAAFERPVAHHNQRSRQQPSNQNARKPNRVTLAVRTRAPVAVSSLGEPAASSPFSASLIPAAQPAAHTEPSFTQLVAPPQFQSASSSSFAPSQAAPAARQQVVGLQAPSSEPSAAGPALSSFRAAATLGQSVSARHSALMAQVAAERQAAAALTNPEFSVQQAAPAAPRLHTLAEPLEAFSQPAAAQMQPPPTVHHETSAAGAAPAFVGQPDEPLAAPSFEHVMSQGCPHKGVFSYPNKDYCDRYYMCTNGTFTEEACPNGLAYGQMGAVYQHCAYNWNVDCANKKTSEPLASPGCPWQFGIFPITSNGRCSIDYYVCEWGVPETKRCSPEGLFYDDRIKGCQWADQLGCKSEALLNFKCPAEDEDNPYWPYPRYYHNKQDVVVCVNEQPRLVHCNEDQVVDPSSLACMDLNKNKKKKKF